MDASGPGAKLPKVLVVDDEAGNLFTFQRALRRDFEILMASSGEEALRILAMQEVDVLVADYAMPHMDGRELLKRARERHPNIPCIFVTAYAELDSVRETARQNGVVKVLMKPWDKETLTHWLNHCASMNSMRRSVDRLRNVTGSTK
jgi:CheY-like chemotaxis protein